MYIQNSNSSEHDTLQGIADNVPPALHARRTYSSSIGTRRRVEQEDTTNTT